eukprot:3028116-Rhodomonas_salina.2
MVNALGPAWFHASLVNFNYIVMPIHARLLELAAGPESNQLMARRHVGCPPPPHISTGSGCRACSPMAFGTVMTP